jgi:hypothetical protein
MSGGDVYEPSAADTVRWKDFPEEALFFGQTLVQHAHLDTIHIEDIKAEMGTGKASNNTGKTTSSSSSGTIKRRNSDIYDLLLTESRQAEFGSRYGSMGMARIAHQMIVLPPLDLPPFLSLMDHRQAISHHMHTVLAAACNKSVLEAAAGSLSAPEGGTDYIFDVDAMPSPTLRIGILSLFPLIKSLSRTDPELKGHVLSVLLEILHSLPCLALEHEPTDCLDSFRELVTDLATAKETKPEQKGSAVSALLGVCLQLLP